MGNKSSKERLAANSNLTICASNKNLNQGGWHSSIPIQWPVPNLCVGSDSSISRLPLTAHYALSYSARQVKQLIKMKALAPRYPGLNEADEQFNDECPICFFRCN